MSEVLDALTCFAVACVLFPLGVWGRLNAEDLVAPGVLGYDREHRVTVLRRGARACQVVAVIFLLAGFGLLAIRP